MANYTITGFVLGDDKLNFKDTTYGNATTSEDGLMSATDKERLEHLQRFVEGVTMPSTFDMNDVTDPGVYYVGDKTNVSNWPHADGWLIFCVFSAGGHIIQVVFGGRNNTYDYQRRSFWRMRFGGNWKPWLHIDGSL